MTDIDHVSPLGLAQDRTRSRIAKIIREWAANGTPSDGITDLTDKLMDNEVSGLIEELHDSRELHHELAHEVDRLANNVDHIRADTEKLAGTLDDLRTTMNAVVA